MATSNLSVYDPKHVPSGKGLKIAVAVAEWNSEITFALRDGTLDTLRKHGVADEDISIHYVSGTFELSTAANWLTFLYNHAVICLGCVIKGETPHFDYICQAVANGLTQVAIQKRRPIIFGVLTTLNREQALERAGGRLGNKGVEAAVTALKMIDLRRRINEMQRIEYNRNLEIQRMEYNRNLEMQRMEYNRNLEIQRMEYKKTLEMYRKAHLKTLEQAK